MIDINEELLSFLVITLKGTIAVYKVKNTESQSIDSCYLEWTTSGVEILRQRTQIAL